MIRCFSDYRVVYDVAGVRESRWRNVEIAFIIDRPKEWGITDKDFRDEADEIFRRFLAETTFTTFPIDYISGGFEKTEESEFEPNTFRLEIEYSDYDYKKFFTRVILIKDVNKLWDAKVDIDTEKDTAEDIEKKKHRVFWDELSRQIRDVVESEFMWGSKRPSGISSGGRPGGG